MFRWGRWRDILQHGRFKKQLAERDVEWICRALLAYCLVHYRGDDKIKSFMWDLIAPTEDGRAKELQNHLGTNNSSCFCTWRKEGKEQTINHVVLLPL